MSLYDSNGFMAVSSNNLLLGFTNEDFKSGNSRVGIFQEIC
jgi:hypothetical protein